MHRRDDTSGHFVTRLDDHTVLSASAALLRDLDPASPELVSRAAYDKGRQLPGHELALSSRTLTERFKRKAADVFKLSLAADDGVVRMLSVRERQRRRSPAAVEGIEDLSYVAGTLGARSLRPHEYQTERRRILSQDSRSWLHGGRLGRRLSTVAQVIKAVGGWDEALVAAGLEPRGPWERHHGLTGVELIHAFVEQAGYIPTRALALDFARIAGVAVERYTQGWNAYVDEWRRAQLRKGRWAPTVSPPPRSRPAFLAAPIPGAPAALQSRWDYEACVGALAIALGLLPPDRPTLGRDVYKRISKGRGDMPSHDTIRKVAARRGTTRDAMIAEAARRRTRFAQPASTHSASQAA